MKAIFIDAENHEVRDIEINFTEEGGFDEFYTRIGHGCNIVQATYFNKTEALIVDEEGHFRDIHFGFNVNGSHLMGNGIVIGNGDREFTDTNLTAEQVRELVTFFPEKTDFTPGPWKAVWHGEDIYTWTIQGNDEFEERSLAFVGVGTPNLKRDMANAHLIAAAPELYEALKGAVQEACGTCAMMHVNPDTYDFVEKGCPFTQENKTCDYRNCIAILRKARWEVKG